MRERWVGPPATVMDANARGPIEDEEEDEEEEEQEEDEEDEKEEGSGGGYGEEENVSLGQGPSWSLPTVRPSQHIGISSGRGHGRPQRRACCCSQLNQVSLLLVSEADDWVQPQLRGPILLRKLCILYRTHLRLHVLLRHGAH